MSPALRYARRVASIPFRYQSPDEDSARWLGFPFRDGDIVISTRSKTGTTWVQMTSGAGREILSDDELAAYHARVTQLAPSDMLTWLHSSREGL
jgi:hypothetical protein